MSDKNKNIIYQVFQNNSLDRPQKIERYMSGQINHVYKVDDAYVIKIEGEMDHTKEMYVHQKRLMNRLIKAGAKVPRIIDYGEFYEKEYLLMEKLEGRSLFQDWLKFSKKEKENFLLQIIQELKIFHSIKFRFYSLPILFKKEFINLKNSIRYITRFDKINRNKLSKEILKEVDYLQNFFEENINILNEKNSAVLVHNDIHFSNILYRGKKISGIIDFDIDCQAPVDFELRKICYFFYNPINPRNYVSKDLYDKYKGCQMKEEMMFLKKKYRKLFEVDNLVTRLKIYHLEKIINLIRSYQSGGRDEYFLWNIMGEVQNIYHNDALDKFLDL